jgi:hypothetical protein
VARRLAAVAVCTELRCLLQTNPLLQARCADRLVVTLQADMA